MVFLFVLLFTNSISFAEGTSIKDGTAVQFVEWKPDCLCYEVIVEENAALGPFYVTTDSILKALPDISKDKVARSPTSILSTRFVLDKALPLLMNKQYDARTAAIKKTK